MKKYCCSFWLGRCVQSIFIPYGDASCNNSGICGVGEMWGYAMGYIRTYEKYRYYEWTFELFPGGIFKIYFLMAGSNPVAL